MTLSRWHLSRLLGSAFVLGLILVAAGSLTDSHRSVHAGLPACIPPTVFNPITLTCDPPPTAPPAQLIVTKVVVGGSALPSDFAFVVTSGGGPVSGVQSPAPGADSTTFLLTFNAIVTVVETVTQPDYVVDASDCVNVPVALGTVSRCTITNTHQPPPPPPPPTPPVVTTLTVVKVTTPADVTPFPFTTSVGGASLANGESVTFTVSPGAHFVEEALVPDWELVSIVCTGGDPGVVVDARVTLDIDAGEDIVCTFRNERPLPEVSPVAPPVPSPSLSLLKLTNGLDVDVDSGDLPELRVGADVVWTYVVVNTGDVTLTGVRVDDDAATPNDPSDDFSVRAPTRLAPGESTELTAAGIVVEGRYVNAARASAEADGAGAAAQIAAAQAGNTILSGFDASGYIGVVPQQPTALPSTGSGGVGGSGGSLGRRFIVVGLLAVSFLSLASGLGLLRHRQPPRR